MAVVSERTRSEAGWLAAARTAAALASAVGVGRFVFTPILPLMEAQAGLTRAGASVLATGNYFGYLVGAILGIAVPAVGRSRAALRLSAIVLVVSLAIVPLAHDMAIWTAERGIAGVASAVIFVVASNAILPALSGSRPHVAGWAYGGVGAGIAASGLLVASVQAIGDWRLCWWSAAGLTALLLTASWSVGGTGHEPKQAGNAPVASRRQRVCFSILAASYFLEGTGYIIAGTFLVAAVTATTGTGWLSGSTWLIVGLAAIPSCAFWTGLSSRVSRPALIAGALTAQAVGIALPALSDSAAAGVVSALLFGSTFVGVTALSLATGRQLGFAGAVAILIAGYGTGQVIGPLLVTPLLSAGYRPALLVSAATVAAAALGTALLRLCIPRDVTTMAAVADRRSRAHGPTS